MSRRVLISASVPFVLIVAFLFLTTSVAPLANRQPGDASAPMVSGSRALKAPDEVQYAIIAPQGYASEFQPLADWKTDKGVPAKIYTVEDIIGDYPGEPDVPAKIHKFLEDLENAEANLTYVLLASDSESIPPRYLYTNAQYIGFADYYAGDVYYAGLDNDWDTDDDGYYGEYSGGNFDADLNLDVTVGRFPIDNGTHAANVVDKVLNYEKDPPAGDWVNDMEIWGGIMDAPNDPTKYDSWEDNAYKVGEKVKNLLTDNWTITARYDYSQLAGDNYKLSTDHLKKSDVLTPVNDGLSVINYAGQAWYDGTTIAHYSSTTGMHDTNYGPAWPSLFSWSDAAALTNGYKMPFVYLATCDAANFTKTNDQDQERWLYANNGGAIGLLSNTGMSFRGETSTESHGNWWLMENFWKIFQNQQVTQPGVCWTRTLAKYKADILNAPGAMPHKEAILTNFYGYVYLGDPEVDLWTDTPQIFTLENPDLYTGTREYTFKVTSAGEPVPGARICLRSPDLYTYFKTNATGVAKATLTFSSATTVNMTVTAHNFLPKQTSIDVQNAPADVELLRKDVGFSNSTQLKAGEEVTISAKISNLGELPASDTTFLLYEGLPTAGGALVDSVFIGTLDAHTSRNVEVNWTAKGGQHLLFLSATTTSFDLDMLNNNVTVDLDVLFPELSINDADISFSSGAKAVVGRDVEIFYSVSNSGGCDATNVKVDICDGNLSKNGTLLTTQTLLSIAMGGKTSSSYIWTVTPSDHSIYVYVNPDLFVFESDYTDNVAKKLLYVNEAPQFGPIDNITVNEDAEPVLTNNLLYMPEHVSDGDNDFNELSLSVAQSTPNTVSIDTAGYLDLDLVQDWAGIIYLTISANDSMVQSDHDMRITVNEINDPPMIELDKVRYEVYEDIGITLDIDATDVEGDIIQFSTDSELVDINKTSGVIVFMPAEADLDKTIKVNVTAADARGGKTTITLTFDLIDVNDPPTLTPIADQELWVGDTLDIQIHVSDPDSTNMTFKVYTDLFDIGLYDGWIHYTPEPADSGVNTISIEVSDNEGGVDSFSFVLTVKYNDTGDEDDDIADDDTGFKSTYLIGIVIAALVILAIIIVIVVLLTRKKPEPEADSRSYPEEEEDDRYRGEDREEDYYDDDQDDYDEPEYEEERPRKKGKKGKGKTSKNQKGSYGTEVSKDTSSEKDLEYYEDVLLSQLEEEEAPVKPKDKTPLMDDIYVGGDEEMPEPESYAETGEMDFDDDSFDDAFGEDLDTDEFDPDYEDEDD